MNENWEICSYVDYCDGPSAQGMVPTLWYKTNYTYRWQVLLDVFAGTITYGRVDLPKIAPPVSLVPATIPGAISVSMAFDALAQPIFAVGILDGTIHYYNLQAGRPRRYVRPGTNPRLWYNGLLTEYASSEVVSFSSNEGVLEMRFQRNNYGIPYFLPDFPYQINRVTKTDSYLPENRQYLYVTVGQGRSEKGYLIRSSGYTRYLEGEDSSIVHQEIVGKYQLMAPVQTASDASRLGGYVPYGQYIPVHSDFSKVVSRITGGMYFPVIIDRASVHMQIGSGYYGEAVTIPISEDYSRVSASTLGLYFPIHYDRGWVGSNLQSGGYFKAVVKTVLEEAPVSAKIIGLYLEVFRDYAALHGEIVGLYQEPVLIDASDHGSLGATLAGEYSNAIMRMEEDYATLGSTLFGDYRAIIVQRTESDDSVANSKILGTYTEAAGITWTNRAIFSGYAFNDVAYGDGLFVVVGSGGTSGKRIVTSEDGTTWTPQTTPTPDINLSSVIYGNGIWVAIPYYGGSTLTSTDGVTWTVHANVLTSNTWQKVTYGNGLFVAVNNSTGSGNRSAVSTDGVTWSSSNIGNFNWLDVAYGAGLFVAVAAESGANNQIATSPDGLVWTARTNAGNILLATICFENGQFVALNQGGQAVTSDDGITWTSHAMGGTSALWDAVCGTTQGLYIAVGQINTNRVTISLDGATWTQIAYADGIMSGVTFGNGVAVTVSTNGHISSSGTIGT